MPFVFGIGSYFISETFVKNSGLESTSKFMWIKILQIYASFLVNSFFILYLRKGFLFAQELNPQKKLLSILR